MGRRTPKKEVTVGYTHKGKAVRQTKSVHTGERGGQYFMRAGRRIYIDDKAIVRGMDKRYRRRR